MKDWRLIFSDHHIGPGGKVDDFKHRGPLMRLLMWAHAMGIREIVIVGDFLELWQFTLDQILEHNAELFRFMQEHFKIIYVAGNHDWLTLAFGTIPILEVKAVENVMLPGDIWVEHGHRFDPFNKPGSNTGRRITKIAGVLEQMGYEDIDKDFGKHKRTAQMIYRVLREQRKQGWKHVFKKYMRFAENGRAWDGFDDPTLAAYAYQEHAFNVMKARKARAVIFGHTHEPCAVHSPHRIPGVYFNSGTGLDMHMIVQKGGLLEVMKWQEPKPHVIAEEWI